MTPLKDTASDFLDELGADNQANGHDARGPYEPDAHREPVKILLRNRRAPDRRGHAATKEVGQSPALAAVQQDQDDEQRTGDGQEHCKNDGENGDHRGERYLRGLGQHLGV